MVGIQSLDSDFIPRSIKNFVDLITIHTRLFAKNYCGLIKFYSKVLILLHLTVGHFPIIVETIVQFHF